MEKISNEPAGSSLIQKISLGEKLAYGSGDMASNLVLVLAGTYATFFYTDALGLNAAVIGSIMFFSRFADGISDVLMGYVIDRTKSKYGKARPWLLWLGIPIAVATVLLFLVPNTGEAGKYVYVAITYNLVTTVLYTAINLPYGTLNSLMSRDQNQRMVINAFRMTMAQIGSLIINAMTLPLVNALGGSVNQSSWVIMAILYGILAAVLFLLCFAKCKERVTVSSQQKEKLSLKKAFGLAMHNKYRLMLCGIFICYSFAMVAGGLTSTYYAKYILGNENFAGFINSAGVLPGLIVIPLLAPMVKKFGKRNVAFYGSFIGFAGQLLMSFSPAAVAWILVCSFLKGVGFAVLIGTFFAMIADTIEYGEWHTGARVEGVLYSSTTFGAKVGAGLGASILLGMLGSAGYDGLAAVQPQAALDSIRIIFLYAPVPFYFIIAILYFTYKLDKIYPQVISELQERERKSGTVPGGE
jgi:GPH family glycoside/pentoside/hexuronide:cation symporter